MFKLKKYYIRVIGFFLTFGGFGLIFDEIVQGSIPGEFWGHEVYGLILMFIGAAMIRYIPKGKTDER